MSVSNRVPPRVRAEAAEWFVVLREAEVDTAGQESFDRWLRTSPDHVRAFLRISAVWDGAADLTQSALRETPRQTSEPSPIWQRIAACLLFAALIAGGAMWWLSPRTLAYETGAGELRTVRLPDGSVVQINARSRIESTFTAKERVVDLVAGEALFSVVKDATRPFSVRSDASRARVVGTQFDVYRKPDGTVVTVVQGAVSVGNTGAEVLVSAGEQAKVAPRAPLQAHPTNVAAAIAWTEGQLVFDSTRLADVVAEFNRVGLRRLVLEDNTMLDLHISGSFPAHDPSSLIEFLRARLGVSVAETNQEVRVQRAAKQ